MRQNRITLESVRHGQYQCRPADLDKIIEEYGHMTIFQLQRKIETDQGMAPGTHSVGTRTEGFMILAELRGFATN